MAFPWGALIGQAGTLFSAVSNQKTQASDNAAQVAIAKANAQSQLAVANLQSNNLNKMIPLILGGLAVLVILALVFKKK